MKHLRKPTMPVTPWDAAAASSDPSVSAIIRAKVAPVKREKQVEKDAQIPVDNDCIGELPAFLSPPVNILIGRTFMGRLNVSDLDYMAKAILELLDKMHELQERVRILEAAQK